MKLSIHETTINLSENESEFVARIANDTCLSIHDLILLAVLAFCKDKSELIKDQI